MYVATGNFQLPRFIFENGYVEISSDGETFERVGDLDCGGYTIEYPARPIKAVRWYAPRPVTVQHSFRYSRRRYTRACDPESGEALRAASQ